MTRIGIVGAGKAATLHAEAIRVMPDVELSAISAGSDQSASAALLSGEFDCPVLAFDRLGEVSDALVVATPPQTHAPIVDRVTTAGRTRALLVESPVAITLLDLAKLNERSDLMIMTGANLLHAPAVLKGLTAISRMNPHHLELRVSVPQPRWGVHGSPEFGGGVLVDPTAGLWPILLAAVAEPVISVTATATIVNNSIEQQASVALETVNGRTARAELSWGAAIAQASLEAADAARVVRIDIWPSPTVEIDGQSSGAAELDTHPLAALGFSRQLDRLCALAEGASEPWPDVIAGYSAVAVALAAALSISRQGEAVATDDLPLDRTPAEVIGATGAPRHK